MAIVYNENKKTFSLHTARTTYQLKIGNLNYVKHLYYGATIRDEDLVYLIRQYDRGFSGNPYDSLKERTFSLDAQPQEFTTQQQGDFRINSIEVQNSDGFPQDVSWSLYPAGAAHCLCHRKRHR